MVKYLRSIAFGRLLVVGSGVFLCGSSAASLLFSPEFVMQALDTFSQNIRASCIELFFTKLNFLKCLLINSKLDFRIQWMLWFRSGFFAGRNNLHLLISCTQDNYKPGCTNCQVQKCKSRTPPCLHSESRPSFRVALLFLRHVTLGHQTFCNRFRNRVQELFPFQYTDFIFRIVARVPQCAARFS